MRVNPKVETIFKLHGNQDIVELAHCTILIMPVEQLGAVRFLWAEGVKRVEIHHRVLAQCGQSTTSQQKVYEWVKRFKWGRTRVTDKRRSGRPSTSRSQKASSPQEYRNQLNDITNALCCKGTV